MWLQFWLGSLELLALLLAATIHDVDHPGTTNTFQMNTKSVASENHTIRLSTGCVMQVRSSLVVQ